MNIRKRQLKSKKKNNYKIAFLSHVDYNLYLFRLPVMLELKRIGWEVYAICPKGEVSDRFDNLGIKHIEYKIERKNINPFREFKTLIELYKILKSLDLDILHTFTYKPNIYGTIAGRIARIPIIINLIEGLGSLYVEDNFKNRVLRYIVETMSRIAYKLSDKCIVMNSDDVEYLVHKKILPKDKAILIKSAGIDVDDFSPVKVNRQIIDKLKLELGLKSDQVVVLMISRLLIHKGIIEYLKAAEILKEKFREKVEFLLVGSFDMGSPYNIQEEVLKDFIERKIIKFLGWRNDVKELLALSDIFVLPSYREGVPRTLLEAGAMEKPIVTSDAIGCREVVENGKNGFIVPVKDYKTLAEKIEILIINECIRREFGKKSREKVVNEFNIKNIVRDYLNLYNYLLNEKYKN